MDRVALRARVIDSLEDQIVVIDAGGTILDVNAAWERSAASSGLEGDDCGRGSNYLQVTRAAAEGGDKIAAEAAQGIDDVVNGRRELFYFEYPCHSPGEKRWFMMRVTKLRSDAERLFVVSHHDITQRKLAEEQAEYLALHDPLTGLANRRHFERALEREWRHGMRDRTPISVIMVDLDRYKDYNDALGHLAGDECLVVVSRILQAFCRRPGDLAVRFGGDELGLMLAQTELRDSMRIAEEIRGRVTGRRMTFGADLVTVSAGVACVVPGRTQSPDVLVREADRALYEAKRGGRNRVLSAQAATGGDADPVH